MSDETEIPEGDDAGEAPAKKKMAGKTLVLFVILPALLVVGGGGAAAAMLLGGGDKKAEAAASDDHGDDHKTEGKDDGHGKSDDDHGKSASKDDHGKSKDDGHGKSKDSHGKGDDHDNGVKIQIGAPGEPSFYTLPDMLVNLSSTNGRQVYLKLRLTLESDDPATFDEINPILPRVTDQFQMFLRELRMEDLDGTAGQYRLRRELLRRVNLAIQPTRIDAVLIEEMLVQ